MTYSNATLEKRYAYKTTTDSLYLTELLADGSAGKQEAYRMDYLWINQFAIYQFGGHESLLFSLKE